MDSASAISSARLGAAFFTRRELSRVGVAATMIVVCGTLIIVAMLLMLGHYSTLSHCGPKAALDGAVVTLLIGREGRWRCLALLGVVYGFVLLLQIGVFYLLPVMAIAGVLGASGGWLISWLSRGAAVVIAAGIYELFCGFGAPVQIYFGVGSHEPLVWGLWFLEWPLRIGGGCLGAWLCLRWLKSRAIKASNTSSIATIVTNNDRPVHIETFASRPRRKSVPRTHDWRGAGVRLAMCIVACIAPMTINSPRVLGVFALLFVIYAWLVGMRWRIAYALAGVCWGWIIFGAMSYLWHHDFHRVWDLGRTLVLRFLPLAMASIVLANTVRPVDLFRLLRKLHLSGAVLIPLAAVARALPRVRQTARQSMGELKRNGIWFGPTSLLRHPISVIGALIGPQIKLWADQLIEKPVEEISSTAKLPESFGPREQGDAVYD